VVLGPTPGLQLVGVVLFVGGFAVVGPDELAGVDTEEETHAGSRAAVPGADGELPMP
jgi:hypothetical protein